LLRGTTRRSSWCTSQISCSTKEGAELVFFNLIIMKGYMMEANDKEKWVNMELQLYAPVSNCILNI